MLPTPLSVNAFAPSAASSSSGGLSRSSGDEAHSQDPHFSDQLVDAPFEFTAPQPRYPQSSIPLEGQASRQVGGTPVLRSSVVLNQYPGETPNPLRASLVQPYAVGYEEPQVAYTPENEDQITIRTRGVSLVDNGPVTGPDGVRRIPRSKRSSSQQPTQNRYSKGPFQLPPGAAPPQPGFNKAGN